MVWIFAIVSVLVDIVNLLGFITPVSTQVLALSVISWGKCSGDAATTYSISKNGHSEMAITGAIASALTNLMLGLGLTCLLAILEQKDSIPLPLDSKEGRLDLLTIFLAIIATLVLTALPSFTKFVFRKRHGIILIVLYAISIVAIIVVGEIQH